MRRTSFQAHQVLAKHREPCMVCLAFSWFAVFELLSDAPMIFRLTAENSPPQSDILLGYGW
jgi:hypothetical protein